MSSSRGSGSGGDLFRQAEQAVGFAGHRRRHDHHLVAGLVPFRDALGDVPDALGGAHRGAAVFLYDECHCRFELEEKPRFRLLACDRQIQE